LGDIQRELRRPLIQRSVFELAKASPKELVRSTFFTAEIQHRALTHLPDDLFRHIPERTSTYSLFQGFQASKPEEKKKSSRSNDKGQKLLGHDSEDESEPAATAGGLKKLSNKKAALDHKLDMMGIRKNMCISEIRDIDTKIANLNTMRKIVLQRLAGHEQEEIDLEHEIQETTEQIQDVQEQLEDAAALATKSPPLHPTTEDPDDLTESTDTFMSESIFEKLPTPSPAKKDKDKDREREKEKKKRRVNRRKSMPVLHEHMEKGSRIREFQAHNDTITALDFDAPFGTLVSAALDDTVRVWDLNAGRCIGLLEGHLSSVRCLQVQDNLVATGSMDASIRLWDLNQADYTPPPSARSNRFGRDVADEEEDDVDMFSDPELDPLPVAPTSAMQDCLIAELSAHVAEVTALHFHKNTLVSGSADKTLRQWDIENGRCVQTLDVMWAAAQASVTSNTFNAPDAVTAVADSTVGEGWWRPASGRPPPAEADFVGAIQVFETALACGTADGMVRLWDLRSGSVHRSLVGHTGPITSLAFSGIHMVTGSADRSIRVCSFALQKHKSITKTDCIPRSGIFVRVALSMHLLTTLLLSILLSIPGILCLPLANLSSKFMTRQMAINGTVGLVTCRKKAKVFLRLLSVFASRMDIWSKVERMVSLECGHVDIATVNLIAFASSVPRCHTSSCRQCIVACNSLFFPCSVASLCLFVAPSSVSSE
jgi:division protein 1